MSKPPLCPDLAVGVPFTVWVVRTGATGDNTGTPNPSLVFTTKSTAVQAAKGRGWHGGHAVVSQFRSMRGADGECYFIGNAIDDIDRTRAAYEEQIRNSALEKLSDVERRVLGISDISLRTNVDAGKSITEA